jgi:hypothetical protein
MSDCKRRKVEHYLSLKKIIELNTITQMWLVEWSDSSRTWISYETLIQEPNFRNILERMFTKSNYSNSYIS